jgi:pyruvate decarboxylase
LQSFLHTFSDVNRTNDIPVSQREQFQQSHADDRRPSPIHYELVRTKSELDQLLESDVMANGGHDGQTPLRLIEVILSRGDAPKALLGQAQATQKSNEY